jgi:hypothetical protein
MRWNKGRKAKDGTVLRHPRDGSQWKSLDTQTWQKQETLGWVRVRMD